MRCFIAIEAPKELFSFQKNFKIEGIKLVDDFHLTLAFLGEISDKTADEIKEKLTKVSFKKFKLCITRLGAFPSSSHANVIWVGLEKTEALQKLKNQIDEIIGLHEARDFVPHITLGRVKFVKNKETLHEKLKLNIAGSFEVNEVILFKSTLTKNGPTYDVLGKVSASS